MHFTQEDYRKIEQWLYQRVIKDTELPSARLLDGTEKVTIVQDSKNKVLDLSEFIRQVTLLSLPDFFNVTSSLKKSCLSLREAVCLIPIKQRRLGLIITYYTNESTWAIYQFVGKSLNQWNSPDCWVNIVQKAVDELLVYPDEEDVTGVKVKNKTYLKFKDKEYNPEEFSGKGTIILRKNITGTEACSIDDEDHMLNLLNQKMINQENTIYIIKYDFDLNGNAITIPEGCELWFQGGSINNGSIYLNDTPILGIFNPNEIGSYIKLFGNYHEGQVLAFNEEPYKLKWYIDGEWLPLLDSRDKTSIESLIKDCEKNCSNSDKELSNKIESISNNINTIKDDIKNDIDSINSRISSVTEDLSSITSRVVKNEADIDYINNGISVLQNNLAAITTKLQEFEAGFDSRINALVQNYLEQNLNTFIEKYLKEHLEELIPEPTKSGIEKIQIGDQEYAPLDGQNYIVLPEEYPTAAKTKGKLILKYESQGDQVLVPVVFDGSKDVDMTTLNVTTPGPGEVGPGGTI